MRDVRRDLLAFSAAALVGLAVGWAIVSGFAFPLVTAVAATALVVLLARSPGWGLGVWLLAVTNTIPFVDLESFSLPGLFRAGDMLMVSLVLAVAVVWMRRGSALPPGWRGELIVAVAATAIAWWFVVFVTSWGAAGVPPKLAALYGRDLLYAPVALLSAIALLTAWRDTRRVLIVTIAGACVFATGVLGQVVFGLNFGWIVHPYLVASTSSLTRVYQGSYVLVWTSLPLAFWMAAISHGRVRITFALASALLGAGMAISLGRATYVAVGFGILVSLACALFTGGRRKADSRAAAVAMVALTGVMLIGVATMPAASAVNGSTSVTSAIYSRIGSLFADLTNETGGLTNWSYRVDLAARMQEMLGAKGWVAGLGFLHPEAHYVEGLPQGSIRNSDVGAMTALMPSGLVGLVLALSPAFLIVVAGFRLATADLRTPFERAARLGFVGFFSGALVSSITLTVLVSGPVGGLVAGLAATVLLQPVPCVSNQRSRLAPDRSTLLSRL